MRVSAAPFAGHASGGPPAAAHVRDAELRGGHLGHAAKADDLQLKSEGRDFVYVGADDIYLCPAGERPRFYTTWGHFQKCARTAAGSALPQRTDIVGSTG